PMPRQHAGRILNFLLALLALACAVAYSGIAPRGLASEDGGIAAPAFPAAPFRSGETLRYQVAWTSFPDAALLILRVLPPRSSFPASDWHFQVVARTLAGVRRLYPMNDRFDSDSVGRSLASREFDLHRDEPGRKQDRILQLLYPGESSRSAPPHVVVPLETRDPLGALYALRTIDWQNTADWSAPVYDGNYVYILRAHRENSPETVVVPAGRFLATRISIRLFQYDREVPGKSFIVWLARNSARTPVQMEAELPVQTLRVQLAAAGY
ncbi:MAG: DUF3108 domain-containing protein, partial [Candidatus Acidiferrales bacterium]